MTLRLLSQIILEMLKVIYCTLILSTTFSIHDLSSKVMILAQRKSISLNKLPAFREEPNKICYSYMSWVFSKGGAKVCTPSLRDKLVDFARNKTTNTPFLQDFHVDFNHVTLKMIPWLQLEGSQS